jgi:S-adenosylmethionine:tRNA ribosyltransferase-isomerase
VGTVTDVARALAARIADPEELPADPVHPVVPVALEPTGPNPRLHIRDFDYDLPSDLIAQQPSGERADARLLVLSRPTAAIAHTRIAKLPSLLSPGDLIVANDTRVFPARLLGKRVPSGGAVECLLIGRTIAPGGREGEAGQWWEALMHPGQKLKIGAQVVFAGAVSIYGQVAERRGFGRRVIRLWTEDGSSLDEAIDRIGHVPLPPYIHRPDRTEDQDRYQTVFATRRGSVAAPTAGLHFSPALIGALEAAGVSLTTITLHVGYGTFQPVRVDEIEQHRLEAERYEIGGDAADAIERARAERRRVIAVGTTTTRTLEAVAAAHGGRVVAGAGSTDLFIYPGFTFRVIDGLLTNFHVPRSSLLMLVAAFAGREAVLNAYRAAVEERYRFYSYGDAMLVL